jgi:hypothetical protein
MNSIIEFLRHATGLCGEPHPSLLTLLGGFPVLGYLIYKMKNYGIFYCNRKGSRSERKR